MASVKYLVGAVFDGIVEVLQGGFKFPDGSTQTQSMNNFGRLFAQEKEDFWANTVLPIQPFIGAAFGSGSAGTAASSTLFPGHPGIILMRSSTTANSGIRCVTDGSAIVLQGGEEFNCVFNMGFGSSTGNFVFGFTDAVGASAATDGAFIQITVSGGAGVATGKCANNGSTSNTTSTGALTANTWYRGKVKVNVDATLVTFTIYTMTGTQVWQDTVSTNIPKTSGRACGAGCLGWDSGTTAVDIVNVDFMDMWLPVARGGF